MPSLLQRRPGWCAIANVLLAAALLATLVFFGAIGRTTAPDATSSDKRARLPLTIAERDIVLGEMRGLLTSSQAILDAALANDLKRAAQAARAAGMGEVENIPMEIRGPLIGKLPLEFKQLGFSVHRDFDQIALDADSLGDRDHTLKQLSQLMQKCVACHASYAIAADTGKMGAK